MDLNFITIDPNFVQNCDAYNAPGYLLLSGAIAIFVGGVYITGSLMKSMVTAYRDGYKKEKKYSGKLYTLKTLFKYIFSDYKIISQVIVLFISGLIFAFNAIKIILAIVNSGCL